MTKLFLHVGYPKTGSTTLQRHLFSRHPELFYLGRPFSETFAAMERGILTLDPERFEMHLPAYQAEVCEKIADSAGRPILLSHEGFLRNTRHGGHDVKVTAERLHRTYVETLGKKNRGHAIICLRNQADLILSYFVQFVKGTQGDLDCFLAEGLADPSRGFLSSLYYHDVVDHYVRIFGEANVTLFLFEDFSRDTTEFVARLSALLGIDADASLALIAGKHEKRKRKQSDSYLTENRRSHYFVLSRALRLAGLKGLARAVRRRSRETVALSEQQISRIADVYQASNSAIAARHGLDLAKHGYPLERRAP